MNIFERIRKSATVFFPIYFGGFDSRERLLVTHDDLDGSGCRVVARVMATIFGRQTLNEVRLGSAPAADEYLTNLAIAAKETGDNNRIILITDLGIRASTLNALDEAGLEWFMVDHHVPYLVDLDCFRKGPNVCTSSAISATRILHTCVTDALCLPQGLHCAHTHSAKMLVEALSWFTENVSLYDTGYWGDWDLWEYDSFSSAAKLNFLHGAIGQEKFITIVTDLILAHADMYFVEGRCSVSESDEICDRWIDECDTFNAYMSHVSLEPARKMFEDYTSMIDLLQPIVIKGYDDLRVNLAGIYPNAFSMISKRYLDLHPECDVLAAIDNTKNAVSLRTIRDDIDLSEIARKFGGGGHKKAAGFPKVDSFWVPDTRG